jgi:hypothetical protein
MEELEEFVEEVSGYMIEKANKEVLRYLVSQKMFFDCCDRIADVHDAVGFEFESPKGGGWKLYCHACVDDVQAAVDRAKAAVEGLTVTVYDGKVLFRRKR